MLGLVAALLTSALAAPATGMMPAGAVDAALIARWRDRIGEAWMPVAEHLAPGLAEFLHDHQVIATIT